MNRQKIKFLILLLITVLLYSIGLDAQTKTIQHENTRDPRYVDITVQAGTDYLYLEALGADGGASEDYSGGAGARVSGYLTIGDGPNQVPIGSTIRLIPGQAGMNSWEHGGYGHSGDGGGGTAVACKVGTNWHLLMVAGGGGAAGAYGSGREGNFWEAGSNGIKDSYGAKLDNGGDDGNGGTPGGKNSGGGGYKVSMPNGVPLGFIWDQGGPFGFGNGGYGYASGESSSGKGDGGGGGGGGYSGGGGGKYGYGGGGGGSYVNEDWITEGSKEDRGNTSDPQDGYVNYEFTNIGPKKSTIQLLHSSIDKCIHTRDDWMGEGAWLELWDCQGTTAQQWVLKDNQIKPFNNTDRCVTIKNADDTNGSQLILWNCYGDKHQQWVYDGVKRLIRSRKNLNKCFALSSNTTGNGTLIQLMECNTGNTQQWQIDGATTSPTDERVQTIRPAYAPNKCFHTKGGSTDNGANVELWDCLGTEAQEWYFIGAYIKFNSNQDKCLTLPVGDMPNGTNIYLEDCDGGYRQEWIYDGLTQSIRSGKSLNKCIHIKQGSSANGANVELWNCLGTIGQQFEIK